MKNPISLSARLTLYFSMVSTSVLLLLGWTISSGLNQHLAEEDARNLNGKIRLVENLLEEYRSQSAETAFVPHLKSALVGHHDLTLELRTLDNEVLFATDEAGFPANLILGPKEGGAHISTWQYGGRRYRGLSKMISSNRSDIEPLRVSVATDLGRHQEFLKLLNRSLSIYIAVAVVISGLLCRWAVRGGLAPLRIMKTHAAMIDIDRLDQRLHLNSFPTELRDLAAEFNQMLTGLNVAFNRLSTFSADLAHELRTPVSNLLLQTQVCLSKARDPFYYLETLEVNAEELQRLARMVSDMLLLARAENGFESLRRETIDLGEEVQNLFGYYDALASEGHVALQMAGNAQLAGDRQMLRRALSNLLSNAVRHTHSGGAVTVTIEDTVSSVDISVENPGDIISDTDLPRIFDRFYRPADEDGEGEDNGGAGLGLAITRAIVLAHRGKILAESRNGTTRILMNFPKKQ